MIQNQDFDRLKLLEQAREQLEALTSLKQKLRHEEVNKFREKQDLVLKERSNNLISLYHQILSLYPSQFGNENNKQTDNISNHHSHSRSRLSEKQKTHKNRKSDVKNMLIKSALCCTIGYIQINFLCNLQQGSAILLKSKSDIGHLIQKLHSQKQLLVQKSWRNSQMKNLGQKGMKSYDWDEQQSAFSQMGLSRHRHNQTAESTNPQSFTSSLNQLYFAYIRVNMNLVINLILENRHTFAIEIFHEMIQFIQSIQIQNTKQRLILFIYQSWFNIPCEGFITLKEKISNFRNFSQMMIQDNLSIDKAFILTHFIFDSDLFSPPQQSNSIFYPLHFIEILEKSIAIFTQSKLYELSFFTLRHLLQSPISPELKQKYYLQLKEMLENGKLNENILLQNAESVETFRSIIDSLNLLQQKQQNNLAHQRSFQLDKSKNDLFRLVIKLQMSKILFKIDIDQNQKEFLLRKLQLMKNQTNLEIITSMLNQKLAQNVIESISEKINKLIIFTNRKIQKNYNAFLAHLKSYQNQKQQSSALTQKSINTSYHDQNKSQLKLRTVSPSHSRKYLKVISTSVLTDFSTIHPQTYQKHRIFEPNLILNSNEQKISKMIRFCEHGAFLNKRNFNTDGGESKFIKITHDKIKWSKNPQKINQSAQSYPLQDIKGVLYGKVTPNLKKPCNKNLKEELCFSLILQKRTMDFCCKDYKEVESWVCGISQILKRQNPQILRYTPGKMRWRKMFANLRQAFIQPLKPFERNQFYFQNAYSLILFKKNGYKLPSNQKIL